MPFVPGLSGLSDVYRSYNVYANGVPVALWNNPQPSSASFAGLSVSPVPDLNAGTVAVSQAVVSSYVASPNSYYNATAETDGVKANFPGAQDDGTTSTGVINTATFAGIIPALNVILSEASRGLWREHGQGAAQSNPNILNIWSNLGYPASGMWLTDQTPWCAGFVNFVLKTAGYKYVQTASAQAITTTPGRWGAVQVSKANAQPGDIAYWSYSHVNFVYTANAGKFSFVGGNQTPTGGSNNPSDGDVTNSYPSGTVSTLPSWVSCWRPTQS